MKANISYCKQCGKVSYNRRAKAERLVWRQKKRKHTVAMGSVYLCEYCGKYHITHYSYEKNKEMKTVHKKPKYKNLVEFDE